MLGDYVGARDSTFSIDDYGYGPPGPYQIMEPAYPAPKWLGRYVDLGKALQECQTLCTLKGRPYRVVRWGREGAGNAGGIPCKTCKPMPGGAKFPRHFQPPCRCAGGNGLSGCDCGLSGEPASSNARPLAEFRPGGEKLVFDAQGNAHIVGRPAYTVSKNPDAGLSVS